MTDKEQYKHLEDTLKAYLGLTDIDFQDEELPQDWNGHLGAVNTADQELTYQEHVNAVEDELIDLSTLSLVDKVELLTHDTLDQLLTGEAVLENAQELIATIQAVDMVISVGKDV